MKKAYLCYYPEGLIIIDEQGNILGEKKLSIKELEEAIKREKLTSQEREFIERFKEYEIISEIKKEGIPQLKGCCRKLREKLRKIVGLETIKQRAYESTSLRFAHSMTKDKIAVMLATNISAYEKIINDHVVRIRELAVYAYPGFYETCKDNKQFIKAIAKGEAHPVGFLKGVKYDEKMNKLLEKLAKNALELYELKEKMEKLLIKYVKEVMPNTSYLVGEKLAAKLLEEAGSLEKLAKMPSSTIQVIGAEKALFMHLLGKGKSPKHGIIFLSDYIQKAPPKKRGKVARILALKISKAVRLDYFDQGKIFKGEEIKKELEDALKNI
ncbi:MAG: hypothetical protein GXN99_00960 [Candidatus Nanohaloarchaeota archaeon]|nr:hypothetical protein [Candidatus Nanohaloarchaeota archaeon]